MVDDIEQLAPFFNDLQHMPLGECRRKHKVYQSRNSLIQSARLCGYTIHETLRNKGVRSNSGVVVITVVMKPDQFSCPNDCHYCPNEPGQPRSYLSNEPAVARANEV